MGIQLVRLIIHRYTTFDRLNIVNCIKHPQRHLSYLVDSFFFCHHLWFGLFVERYNGKKSLHELFKPNAHSIMNA